MCMCMCIYIYIYIYISNYIYPTPGSERDLAFERSQSARQKGTRVGEDARNPAR